MKKKIFDYSKLNLENIDLSNEDYSNLSLEDVDLSYFYHNKKHKKKKSKEKEKKIIFAKTID